MLRPIHIAMSSSRDVEISLDFIEFHGSPNPTRITLGAPLQPRRLLESLPTTTGKGHDILKGIILLVIKIIPLFISRTVFVSQRMHALDTPPRGPGSIVLLEHGAGQDQIARGVLHVDVQVSAVHRDHDVQVDLHHVPDALLDAELPRLVAPVPAPHFAEREDEAGEEKRNGPLPTPRVSGRVAGFGLGCVASEMLAVNPNHSLVAG